MKSTLLSCAIVSCTVLLASARAESVPLGKQLADYSEKDTTQKDMSCYDAVYNRLKHIFDLNKKILPKLGGEKIPTKFTLLWRSNVDKVEEWKALDRTYKACGPPGAMVEAGLATLVNHKEIWNGDLKPGALVQVWDSKVGTQPAGNKQDGIKVFNNLIAGKAMKDTELWGHAFIFLRYVRDTDGKITGMHIADQGTGWDERDVNEATFGLWIGANLKD